MSDTDTNAGRGGLWPLLDHSWQGHSGYSILTSDEWTAVEAAYGAELCEDIRRIIDYFLWSGAETQEHSGRPYRQALVQDRIEDLQEAVANLFEVLDIPTVIGVASGMDALRRPPQSIGLARSKTAGGDVWDRLEANVTGDAETHRALQLVNYSEDALQVLWAFGHAAWQVQRQWTRDPGGKKPSLDQHIVQKIRQNIIKHGYSGSFTWNDVEGAMSGPFWSLMHELWKLRPGSFAAKTESTLRSKVKSSGRPRRLRTKPRQ